MASEEERSCQEGVLTWIGADELVIARIDILEDLVDA